MVETMTDTSVRTVCPVIRDPFVEHATRDELSGLVQHLDQLNGSDFIPRDVQFSRGSVLRDGRLDLCKQGLRADGTQYVLDHAIGSPLRHLLLGTNGLGSEGVQALAGALTNGLEVETLYLGCNAIDAPAVLPLARALRDTTTVTGLWLKRNPLAPDGVCTIADMVRANTTLEALDLVNTEVDMQSLEYLVDAIAATRAPLHTLFLSGNGLDASACRVLAPLITNERLGRLALSVNPIGDEGIGVLAEAASKRKKPIELGLASTGLTSAAGESVAILLAHTSILDLGRARSTVALGGQLNNLGDHGSIAFAGAITSCSTRALDLQGNRIQGRGASAIVNAMNEGRHALEYLRLGKYAPRVAKQQIASMLRPIRTPLWSTHPIASRYR